MRSNSVISIFPAARIEKKPKFFLNDILNFLKENRTS